MNLLCKIGIAVMAGLAVLAGVIATNKSDNNNPGNNNQQPGNNKRQQPSFEPDVNAPGQVYNGYYGMEDVDNNDVLADQQPSPVQNNNNVRNNDSVANNLSKIQTTFMKISEYLTSFVVIAENISFILRGNVRPQPMIYDGYNNYGGGRRLYTGASIII